MKEEMLWLPPIPATTSAEDMPDRASLEALKNMLEEVELLISTTEPMPENRTRRCQELLRAALALVDDRK